MRRHLSILLIVLLAGCNLDTSVSVTLAPSPTPFPSPTPLIALTPTPDPALLMTPIPAQVLLENPEPAPQTETAIDAFVNNILIPAWNFVYTLFLDSLGSLWVFAGARGGIFAQVVCCVAPVIVVLGALYVRFRFWRRRR